MIQVTVYYSDSGVIAAFEAEGHALFSHRGSDIVCAGVSALIQTALLGLEDLLLLKAGIEQEDGYIYCSLPDIEDEILENRAQLILETMFLGLERIMNKYPGNITLTESFVEGTSASFGKDGRNRKGNGGNYPMPDEFDDLEVIDPTLKKESNPYTFEKLFGVAFLGAMSGLLVYYVYNQLSEESKKMVKETIVSNVKKQIASLGQVD